MELIPTFNVSEYNELIQRHLVRLGEVRVRGEISYLSVKHSLVFVTLSDGRSAMDVFGLTFELPQLGNLHEGMEVEVVGSVGVYQRNSRLRLKAREIVPVGAGDLQMAYEVLQKKLAHEGLFDASHKQPLPQMPERIGLISSKDSSAFYDVVKVLQARMPGLTVRFIPVRVQGGQAKADILQAFSYVVQHADDFDLVILARGGGSIEDLHVFNDEQVVRAAFGCPVPLISAIGHEDDVLLVDAVADMRASTPSNAAELAVMDQAALLDAVERLVVDSRSKVRELYTHYYELIPAVTRAIGRRLVLMWSSLDSLDQRLQSDVTRRFSRFSLDVTRILAAQAQVHDGLVHRIASLGDAVHVMQADMAVYDYQAMFLKGYAMVRTSSGALVRSVADVTVGTQVTTSLADGDFVSDVTTIRS